MLLVSGGVQGVNSDALATTEILTIGDSSWRSVGSLPVAITGIYHAGVSLDNTVFIAGSKYSCIFIMGFLRYLGGYLHQTAHNVGAASDEIFMFDTATEEWTTFGTMSSTRSFHAVSVVNVNDYINFCN